MRFLKLLVIGAVSIHFVCVLLASINSWGTIDKKYTQFRYIDSFFKQGWSFFAPVPVLSNIEIEYKCIYEEKISSWLKFEANLRNYFSPWSKIVPSANTSYIEEGIAGPIVFGSSERSNSFCLNGDCDQYLLEISRFHQYGLLNEIVTDLCTLNSNHKAIGHRVKINTYNLRYFSDLKSKTPLKIIDTTFLPAIEYF